jgi:hypothetical protein
VSVTARRRGRAWRAAAVLCLVPCVAFVGCSGGEGDPPVACLPISFTPAIGTIASGSVFLGELTSTCTSVDVVVMVNDLSGIFTVGFDLAFPASVLSYDSYTAGPLLLKGSPTQNPFFVVIDPSPGVVQVSATRLSPDPSVAAVGSEMLMTLRFSKVSSGTGAIDFDDGSGSLVDEVVLDENGATRPASFQPDHGGIVLVP